MSNSAPSIREMLARLDLPKSGGWVEFNEFDSLSGADYRKIRGADGGDSRGEQVNVMTKAAAEVMIRDWDIPTVRNLSIPRRDPKALDRLAARDLYLLEKRLLQQVTHILEGNEDEGDPLEPAVD